MALMPCDERPYGIGYLTLVPGALRFDWAERHMRSQGAPDSMAGELSIFQGPPDNLEEPGRMPPLSSFRVFRWCRARRCYSQGCLARSAARHRSAAQRDEFSCSSIGFEQI